MLEIASCQQWLRLLCTISGSSPYDSVCIMSRTPQERSVLEPSPTLRSGVSSKISEQTIADRIFSAVMEHRLPAGTKLPENVLCETFGASRARIRRAFVMLAEREVVVLQSNRGAFVA